MEETKKTTVEEFKERIEAHEAAIKNAKDVYTESAKLFRESFNAEVKAAADKIGSLEAKISELEAEKQRLKKSMGGFLIKNNASKVEEIKKKMADIDGKKADLREQIEAIGSYTINGDMDLYNKAQAEYGTMIKIVNNAHSDILNMDNILENMGRELSDLLTFISNRFIQINDPYRIPDAYLYDFPKLEAVAKNKYSISEIMKASTSPGCRDIAEGVEKAAELKHDAEVAAKKEKLNALIASGKPRIQHVEAFSGDETYYLHSDGQYREYPESF